jgi:hypothetical protein
LGLFEPGFRRLAAGQIAADQLHPEPDRIALGDTRRPLHTPDCGRRATHPLAIGCRFGHPASKFKAFAGLPNNRAVARRHKEPATSPLGGRQLFPARSEQRPAKERAEIARRVKGGTPTELEIQEHMLELYRQHGMAWHDKPIVAVGPHAADPHFEPRADNTVPIKPGDRVLIDLWAKVDAPGSIYFDITFEFL